jgi:hypothetical protein
MIMELTQLSYGIEINEEPLITEDYDEAKKFYIANTNENSCVCLCVLASEKNFKDSEKEIIRGNIARILFPASDEFFEIGFHNKAQSNYKIIQKGNRKRD